MKKEEEGGRRRKKEEEGRRSNTTMVYLFLLLFTHLLNTFLLLLLFMCGGRPAPPPNGMGQHGVATLLRPGTGSPPRWDGWKPPPVGLWAWGLGFLKESLQNPSEVRQRSR